MTKARDLSKLLSTANGKIAGSNLDVSFENITDTGTEGTRVATGTNAQRGSTAGQLRFNTETGLAEYYTGTAFKSIDAPPTISSISPTTETDANANITITGSNFGSGATVKFVGNDGTEYTSPSVTVNSSTEVVATTPSTALTVANEPYNVVVSNTSGLSATLADALDAGGSPTWNTASGQVGGSIWENDSVSVSLSATDPDGQTITYSETTSNLSPKGLTLGSNGIITGTASSVSSDTTVSFTARASDGTNNTDRNFNLIIKNDYVDNLDILSDGSCIALWNLNNNTTDVSGNYSATGMSSGSVSYSTTSAFGSHSWNAGTTTGNVFIIPNPRNSYPLTVCAWGYLADWNTSTIGNAEMVNGDINGQRLTLGLVDWSSNGQNEFNIMYGGTNHWTFAYPGGSLSSGWHHVVFSIPGNNNSSHAVYVDATACSATNQGGGHGGSAGWRIGGNTANPANEYFKNGFLDHVRVFNKALSSSEVTNLYNLESARL
jgi:hypothetical protein